MWSKKFYGKLSQLLYRVDGRTVNERASCAGSWNPGLDKCCTALQTLKITSSINIFASINSCDALALRRGVGTLHVIGEHSERKIIFFISLRESKNKIFKNALLQPNSFKSIMFQEHGHKNLAVFKLETW